MVFLNGYLCTSSSLCLRVAFISLAILHLGLLTRLVHNASACAHQLRLAPQYDMHITSNNNNIIMDRERSTCLCGTRSGSPQYYYSSDIICA